jgi:hypothetical protein
MGVYLYKSKPSHVAKALVLEPDGTEAIREVALYEFAYKPYNWDIKANQRMHFRSGAVACEAAWARSKRELPKYGVNSSDGEVPNGAKPFLAPYPTCHDDFVKYDGAQVVRWLELPKGFRAVSYDGPVGVAL